MKLNIRTTQSGYAVGFKGKDYPVQFPSSIWQGFPKGVKEPFVDNMGFMQTMELPLLFSKSSISYNINEPFLRAIYFKAVMQHLPFSSDIDRKPVKEEIKKFLNIKYKFAGPPKIPEYKFEVEDKSIVPLTFGKESMLSYALCEELGLDPIGVAVLESGLPIENNHRRSLIGRFSREFKAKIHTICDGTVLLSDYQHHKMPKTQFGYANTLSGYALINLPFNFTYKARYTILGNEQSCNDSYMTSDGFRGFPVYDQSFSFTKQCDVITKAMSNGSVSVVSLVEPLQELAVMKIFHSRYKKYSRYQMSCFPDDKKSSASRWCHHCSKCARISVFCKALGIDEKSIGITEDMMSKSKLGCFGIFGSPDGDVSFDISNLGRDEQLFSFYLAYKNGSKGYLIDRFRDSFLEEAKSREDELYKKFFGFHSTHTIPESIRHELRSIVAEELL